MTYLVCSPTNITCSDVSALFIMISNSSTDVVLSLEVSWNVQLVHANGRRCPAGTLERVEDPAFPVIFAGVLLPRHRAMNLNHGVQHVLNMLFFRQ